LMPPTTNNIMSQVMYSKDYWSVQVKDHIKNINNWVARPHKSKTANGTPEARSIQPIMAAILLSPTTNTWRIDLSKPLSVPTASTGHFLLSAQSFPILVLTQRRTAEYHDPHHHHQEPSRQLARARLVGVSHRSCD